MKELKRKGRGTSRVLKPSLPRTAASLLLLFSFAFNSARAQTPTQETPTSQTDTGQDARGLAVKPDAQTTPTPTPEQTQPRAARPELVLQTSYTIFGPTGLRFSPDGRLLATYSYIDTEVRLWDVATGRELRAFQTETGASMLGQTNGVASAAFSRDGKLLAAGGVNGSVRVWEVANGRELISFAGVGQGQQGSPLFAARPLVFSPDGRTLVAAGPTTDFYDVTTGQHVRSLDLTGTGNNPVVVEHILGLGLDGTLALTPDGNQFAITAGGEDGRRYVALIDFASGTISRGPKLPDDANGNEAIALAFGPGGHLLAASGGGFGTEAKLWDVTAGGGGRTLAHRTQGELEMPSVAFSSDGRFLSLGTGESLTIWDAASGTEMRSIEVPKNDSIDTGWKTLPNAFTPDGRLVATGGSDPRVTLWDTSTGRAVRTLSGQTNVGFDASFNTDGTRLYAGGKSAWDMATGRGLRAAGFAPAAGLSTYSPDGRMLAVWHQTNNRVELYDAAARRPLQTIAPAFDAHTNRAAFSPDGHLLATSYMLSQEQRERQSQAARASVKPPDAREMQKAIQQAVKSGKDPTAIAQAYSQAYMQEIAKHNAGVENVESEIKLWDVSTGREVRTLTLTGNTYPPPTVETFSFGGDSRTLAVTTIGGPVLFDVSTGQQIQTLGSAPAPTSYSAALSATSVVAVSSDGRLVATGGHHTEIESGFDPSAMITAALSRAHNRRGGMPPPNANPEEMFKHMKTTGPVTVWDAAAGRELVRLQGHDAAVVALTFSRDSRLLASAAADNTIKLWDVSAGRELRKLAAPGSRTLSLAFSPDGSLLVSTSADGGLLLWDVKTGEQLATLISVGDKGDWLVVTPDGLFDGSPAAWNQILWRFSKNTFDVAPVETFFNEFFYPGLLSDIASGKRPKAPRDISVIDRRQPVLALATSAPQTGAVASHTIDVSVRVKDAPAGAKDVRLFRNGSLVRVWHGDVLKGQQSATLEATIPVVAGENRLTAYAFNKDNVKSADAEAFITGADSLKRAGTAYVVAVGVNSYENAQYNLKYAAADAQDFAEELKKQQTQLGKYGRVEVVSLADAEATKANILASLELLSGRIASPPAGSPASLASLKHAEPEDTVVIYFAGHGTAHGNRFYLIPHDLGYTGPRDSLDADGLQTILAHSISDEELQSAVEGLDAGQLLLVIDACNSGQALEAEEKRRGPMNSKGLAQLAYEKGMYILTAAQSYQAALEAAQLGHGLLTYALVEEGLKAMAADDEPKDGLLQAREWLDFATERVPQMQTEKIKQARALNLTLSFAEGQNESRDPEGRSVQRPRAFYRRELESNPLVLAKRQ